MISMHILTAVSANLLRRIATGTSLLVMLQCAPADAAIRDGANDALGQQVIVYAEQRIGQQVGNGECTDLAEQALAKSGARNEDSYGVVTPDADYVWGTKVALSDARPGDILQFRNFRTRTIVIEAGRETWLAGERDHHTAIVEANLGNALVVLEQNVEPLGQVVQRSRVPVASATYSGDADGRPNPWATTSIAVAGTISVYRPQTAR
jgi:hypothetical protein